MFRQIDPLIYNFIKSVDEKQGRSCGVGKNSQRETHQVQKFIIVIAIIAKIVTRVLTEQHESMS